MSFSDYIIVADCDNDDNKVEIPVEPDNTVHFSTLQSQFPHASGLRFKNPVTGAFRAIRRVDDSLFPPEQGWSSFTYIVNALTKDQHNKRKIEDIESESGSKTKRLLTLCQDPTDLIVLGLPYSLSTDELRNYFKDMNIELGLCEIKIDPQTKQSRGFGFIRCCNYEDQKRLVGKKFTIGEREVVIKRPHSKESEPDRLFVGRLTNQIQKSDLKEYFEQFGVVSDVYYPEINRGYAFVTFADPTVATAVLKMNHILKDVNLFVNVADPKQAKQNDTLSFRPNQQNVFGGRQAMQPNKHMENRYPVSPNNFSNTFNPYDSRMPSTSQVRGFGSSPGGNNSGHSYTFTPDMLNAMAKMMTTAVAQAVQGNPQTDYWNPVQGNNGPPSNNPNYRDWADDSNMRY